jgi:hypothetical protein
LVLVEFMSTRLLLVQQCSVLVCSQVSWSLSDPVP